MVTEKEREDGILFSISVPADLARLEDLVDAVLACGREQGLSGSRLSGLAVATEEVFVNICRYSYPEEEGEVKVSCFLEGKRFVVEFSDSGIPFDATSLPDPDITAGIMERAIGGLGIFLARKMTDEVRYRREDGRNVLRIALSGAEPVLTP
jgi:serine/threonine-protein kinase RsbW